MSFAQLVDSSAVAVAVAVDSTTVAPPSPGYATSILSDSTSFGRPARRAELNIPSLLGSEAGIFHYEFGTLGWPEAVSVEGGDPNRTMLYLDDIEFDDLITGRPRFELLPYVSLASVGIIKSAPGIGAGVVANTKSYAGPRPQTDLRYRSGADGLTYIDAVHVQNRAIKALGQGSRLQLLASYSGSSHTGDYPGSRLQTARQLQGRIRLQRPGWSIELYELYNKHLVGAHAGVNPTDGTYDSIYNRLGASVNDPTAQRGTIRNDMRLTYRRFIAASPTTVAFGWSTQQMSFAASQPEDSVDVRVSRYTAVIRQQTQIGSHSLAFRIAAISDRFVAGRTENKPSDESRFRLDATATDSFSIAGVAVDASLGAHLDDDEFYPSAIANLSVGVIRFSAGYTGIRSQWFDARGLGSGFRPLESSSTAKQVRVALSAGHQWNDIEIDATGFYISTSNQVVLWDEKDQGDFARITGTYTRTGAYLNVGYRPRSLGGLYASFKPTVMTVASSDDSFTGNDLESLIPEFWIEGRFGIKRLLFKDDMALDVSIRGSWSGNMLGRSVDSRSGLLFTPLAEAIELNSAARLDVVAEAGVKSATIFLSYENFLYGNSTNSGISLVQYYPIPASRFRFGVFWPIMD
jgi:hypothetical protein